MHARSLVMTLAVGASLPKYEDEVDFAALAVEDADFARIYTVANGKLDFQDPETLRYMPYTSSEEVTDH